MVLQNYGQWWADQARSLIEGIAMAIRREIEAGMRRYEKLVEEESCC